MLNRATIITAVLLTASPSAAHYTVPPQPHTNIPIEKIGFKRWMKKLIPNGEQVRDAWDNTRDFFKTDAKNWAVENSAAAANTTLGYVAPITYATINRDHLKEERERKKRIWKTAFIAITGALGSIGTLRHGARAGGVYTDADKTHLEDLLRQERLEATVRDATVNDATTEIDLEIDNYFGEGETVNLHYKINENGLECRYSGTTLGTDPFLDVSHQISERVTHNFDVAGYNYYLEDGNGERLEIGTDVPEDELLRQYELCLKVVRTIERIANVPDFLPQ